MRMVRSRPLPRPDSQTAADTGSGFPPRGFDQPILARADRGDRAPVSRVRRAGLSKHYDLAKPLAGRVSTMHLGESWATTVIEAAVIEDCHVIPSLREFRRELRILVVPAGCTQGRRQRAPLTVTQYVTHSPQDASASGICRHRLIPGLEPGYLPIGYRLYRVSLRPSGFSILGIHLLLRPSGFNRC